MCFFFSERISRKQNPNGRLKPLPVVNINGLNKPTETQGLMESLEYMTQLDAVHKELTSNTTVQVC